MATIHRNSEEGSVTPTHKPDFTVSIVVSEWNKSITENLFQGAKDTLIKYGVKESHIHRIDVPGSFELVFGAKKALQLRNNDAVIVVGSVIQGETKHFDFVCHGVTQGISQLNADKNLNTPIIFCLLTDNTLQQAQDRSGGNLGNKGSEAALAAISMGKLATH